MRKQPGKIRKMFAVVVVGSRMRLVASSPFIHKIPFAKETLFDHSFLGDSIFQQEDDVENFFFNNLK